MSKAAGDPERLINGFMSIAQLLEEPRLARLYTFVSTYPGALILVNDSVPEAALPGVSLIHHPINGTVLLTRQTELPQATRNEIERVHPEGVGMDGNVQIYLIGSERYISDAVRQEVEAMGMDVRRIPGSNPIRVAANVDQYVSSMHGNHEDEVIIGSPNAPQRSIPIQSWNAHGGDGFLWVEPDSIPEETAEQPNPATTMHTCTWSAMKGRLAPTWPGT